MEDTQILPITIEKSISTSYLDYAMSVIVGRALPDIRDGMKPVHRRVLYAMWELGLDSSSKYRKCAKVVGDVIGKFHPHGDAAVYDTLVRMAQPFTHRYTLIDGQGNFGSVDGDFAAAMRYTECRLAKISSELMADIDKNTVDFIPNYDSTAEEPTVFPTKIPNLLINGSSGIAVGMATKIPPHNLNEVLNALILMIDEPNVSEEKIFSIIKGPDFPTKATILGRSEIIKAYKTGNGSLRIRARAEIEEVGTGRQQIIISEIPYQVNKAILIERIAKLAQEKKITGISDLRDESTDEVRIVIELKRGESADVLLNRLYKTTSLEITFGINMVALVGGIPKTVTLMQVLDEFLNHRIVVVTRRSAFLLKKAEDRAHILLALITAVENIDEVVAIIRSSSDVSEAKARLKARFTFTDVQTNAILDMRLSRLTGLEITKLRSEYSQVLEDISKYELILSDNSVLMNTIREEFIDMRDRYGDARSTEIIGEVDDFNETDLIPNDNMLVTVTHNGYIKRTPLSNFSQQKRGGKGKSGAASRVDDFVERILVTTNHSLLLFFTSIGRVHFLNVYKLPEMNRDTKGRHISNFLSFENGAKIASILSMEDGDMDKSILFATKRALIKRIALDEFKSSRNGILAIKLTEDDELVTSLITSSEDKIFMASRFAKCIQFFAKDIRERRRSSGGFRGMLLSGDDQLVAAEIISNFDAYIMTVTSCGFGKRTGISEYREQSRGGRGLRLCKINKKTGPVVGVLQVVESDEVMMITKAGKAIRFAVSDIPVLKRDTQGVKLMETASDEIISIAVVRDNSIEE
jgi:DNA gyrase subunit A